ncbi:MAG: glycosyltransferase family 4 protein [Flavobacteriia bacterium]|nr:glycosyltransferase family 4 protein [Flavobacteriia bacterium]OJX35931.1 MAG: group 1 glycosyl transferase [Flavobacteriia bacterium 40-80]
MSKTIYFIVPYPYQEAPSQRFRFEQYFHYLKSEGFEIEIHSFLDQKTWKQLYGEGNTAGKIKGILKSFVRRFRLLFSLKKADYIFIHREASHLGPPVFEWIISRVLRRKYIYDFDDAIWLPNYSEANAKFHRLKAYWKVRYCMKWAHQITAGNNYLAAYARQFNSNVTVIPTTIDTVNHHNLTTDYEAEKITIGWTGTHTTMHYLDDLIPVLKELELEYTFDFVVISNQKPDYDLKSLLFVPWNKETEIQDLARLNIGVMPLKQDIWSEGKCGFKGLQYMSLGIPTLMSPVGVNTEIVENGINGFLVQTPAEWKSALELLLQNAQLRREIGKAGKEKTEKVYSVNSNKLKYKALFQ